MDLRLVTFSRPRLTDGVGGTITFPEKGLVVLAYLATRKSGRASRAELAEFLWGDPEAHNTLGNIRQLLARIRARQTEGGFDVLAIEGNEVVLASDNLKIDVNELAAHPERDPQTALKDALAIISGEFLADTTVESPKGMLWIESERTRHRVQFARTIESWPRDGANADPHLLRDACVRLLKLDPFNIVAHRTLLRHYAETGHKVQARALFARYEERIREELGVAPEPELVALMRAHFPDQSAPASPIERSVQAERQASHLLPRLVLLPPSRMPGTPAALASALLEDVTIALCHSHSVAIVAPYTARKIASSVEGRAEELTAHCIGYALETELRQEGNDLLLFCTLTEVDNDELIWANRFNVSAGHLSRTYRDIVIAIVAAAAAQIERFEFEKIAKVSEPTAYQKYLLGQHHLRRIDLAHIRRARKMFKGALQSAPEFANALSGMARAEHFEWLVTARGDNDLLKSSERHARLAIAADRGNPGGYHQLGVTRLYDSDFDESVSALEEAERLAPSHADIIADFADTLVHASDPELALAKIEKAIDLNPLCPDVYWWTAAGAHYCLGNFETALECVDKMDDQSGPSRLAAACWGMLGNKKNARRLVLKTMKVYPDFEIEKWLAIMPLKERWHKEQYREGLKKAGFK